MKILRIVIFALVLAACCGGCAPAAPAASAPVPAAEDRLAELEAENLRLREELAAATARSRREERLLDDLMDHPELIPVSGTLGGTYRYYRDQCGLLGDRYAYAYAEDGHSMVDLLLSYREDGERVEWTLELFDAGGGWQPPEE